MEKSVGDDAIPERLQDETHRAKNRGGKSRVGEFYGEGSELPPARRLGECSDLLQQVEPTPRKFSTIVSTQGGFSEIEVRSRHYNFE